MLPPEVNVTVEVCAQFGKIHGHRVCDENVLTHLSMFRGLMAFRSSAQRALGYTSCTVLIPDD